VLRVTDHGAGIPAEMREKVFLPFERAVSVQHYGGLGLGLYIVRTIVVGLGGTVRVEGERGKGTTFVVTLPRQGPDT
jgi:signal transduction histidine kinase